MRHALARALAPLLRLVLPPAGRHRHRPRRRYWRQCWCQYRYRCAIPLRGEGSRLVRSYVYGAEGVR
ncbi:hypothetical protein GCM10010361_55490 [Streptomyces olivaceiscleroticus]|uniref:Secreted protein n=1 Tax=Streptomyces olivaceiscleroticus TaxID=68245 RepID=A0ABN1AUB6_9ACTN